MFGINITMNSKTTIQTDTWVVASWDGIVSPTFPELELTAEQILPASQIRKL